MATDARSVWVKVCTADLFPVAPSVTCSAALPKGAFAWAYATAQSPQRPNGAIGPALVRYVSHR